MSKKITIRIGVLFLFLLAGSFAFVVLAPSPVANAMLAAKNASLGISSKQIQTTVGPINYLEKGNGETIVFVHGIFARKEHWVDVASQVKGEYRILLLDLPGFGDSQILPSGQYGYEQQAANLLAVLGALKVERAHFAANSMGAQIVGMIAVSDPHKVQSIALIGGPAGVSSPEPSDMQYALAEGRSPLVVQSEQDYQDRMAWLFPESPFIPQPIFRTWAKQEAARAVSNQRIWKEVHESEPVPLGKLAESIDQPTLILWCAGDRIFNVAGADQLHRSLKNSQLYIGDDCGHLPMLDAPEQTARTLNAFLGSIRGGL